MRPRPMMPTVFSNSSVPVNELRFHWPPRERRVRGRDAAGEAQDVPDGELGGRDDVRGRRVHDHDARGGRGLDVDVVEPDAGAGDDLEHAEPPRVASASILVAERIEHRVGVGERAEQRRAVGAVDLAHVEVGPEGVDRGGREFFGDEHDRLRHDSGSFGAVRDARGSRTRADAAPHAIGGEACASLTPVRRLARPCDGRRARSALERGGSAEQRRRVERRVGDDVQPEHRDQREAGEHHEDEVVRGTPVSEREREADTTRIGNTAAKIQMNQPRPLSVPVGTLERPGSRLPSAFHTAYA